VSLLRGRQSVEQITRPAWRLRLPVRARTERCKRRPRIRKLNHGVSVAQTADRKFYATDAYSAERRRASGAKRTTLESKPERGPGGDPLRPVPVVAALPARGAALIGTARLWPGIVPFTPSHGRGA
jgi:hypothetical protein